MPEQFTYLAIDLGCILVPFLVSFHPRFQFVKHWRYFMLPALATALFFIVWDAFFTSIGVWSFSHQYTVGIWFAGLPVEEHLFFICIPYACVFTYYCLRRYVSVPITVKTANRISLALAGLLFVIGVLHFSQLYTSVTFILLAFLLMMLVWKKVAYLPVFYVNFIIILIPFFISNGILTGGYLGRVVVSYNPGHNLGFRLYTIPFEDVFYGMLLQLMNIAGYEYLKKKHLSK